MHVYDFHKKIVYSSQVFVVKMMFSGLKKTGITQNNNNGMKKRDRHQEVNNKTNNLETYICIHLLE